MMMLSSHGSEGDVIPMTPSYCFRIAVSEEKLTD
jgi:hypothetical protein